MDLTEEAIKAAKFKGPIKYADGYGGMAQQDFECVNEPRLGYAWRRESRKDKGRQFYTVDGAEVADLAEACEKLALAPDPESPAEQMRRFWAEEKESPKLEYGATTCRNFAENNASAEPFGTLRAWTHRASDPWHSGINAWSDECRKADPKDWPRWLYATKTAFHELSRGMYLFAADAVKGSGLRCAMDKACDKCPILQAVETSMVASAARPVFPRPLEDTDIIAAKVATCVGHILTTGLDKPIDGSFWTTTESRKGLF